MTTDCPDLIAICEELKHDGDAMRGLSFDLSRHRNSVYQRAISFFWSLLDPLLDGSITGVPAPLLIVSPDYGHVLGWTRRCGLMAVTSSTARAGLIGAPRHEAIDHVRRVIVHELVHHVGYHRFPQFSDTDHGHGGPIFRTLAKELAPRVGYAFGGTDAQQEAWPMLIE